MKARIVYHTPVGIFYGKADEYNHESEHDAAVDLLCRAAAEGTYITFTDSNGNSVVLAKGTLSRTAFVVEKFES